jgi:putative alpha-1,2-mannosidase
MGYGEKGIPKNGKGSGAWVELDLHKNTKVTMKVGISYVSLENARENLTKEISEKDTVKSIRQQAYNTWTKALSIIKVQSDDKKRLRSIV